MSNAEAPAANAPEKKRRGPSKIVMLIIAVVCTGAGASVPWVLNAAQGHHHDQDKEKDAHKEKDKNAKKTEAVPFGEVIVNLHEERMTRYLRIKIVLEVDAAKSKEFTEELERAKPALKSWLIGHLSGKSLKDVGGSIGVKRMQREILEHFEEVLQPEGEGSLRQLLFEEYAVQ